MFLSFLLVVGNDFFPNPYKQRFENSHIDKKKKKY